MTYRTRYTLLSVGIVSFFLLAPFLVLFISGIHYNTSSHSFVRTGLISAVSQPSGADVYLNGKYVGKTSKSIRFLDDGDYQIKLSKPGYFDWEKTLNVKKAYVTSINQNISAVTLFLQNGKKTLLDQNILNFYSGDFRILAVASDKLYLADVVSPSKTESLSLPKMLNPSLQIIPSQNENYYFIYDNNNFFLLDVFKNTIYDYSALIPKNASNFQLSSNGNVYAQEDSNLFKITKKNDLQNISTNIVGFRVYDNSLYALRNKTTPNPGSDLVQLPDDQGAPQILYPNLPPWQSATIYLDQQREFFINADNTLYSLSNTLLPLGNYVKDVKFDQASGKMLFSTGNEIDAYDTYSGALSLITRSGQALQQIIPDSNDGYVFYFSAGQVQNIEIDNRNHQNSYSFIDGDLNGKYYLSPNHKNIFFLSQGILNQIQIK